MSRKKELPSLLPQAAHFLPLFECTKAWIVCHSAWLALMSRREVDPFNLEITTQLSQLTAQMEELERNYLSLLDEYFITHWARLQGAALAKMIAEETAPGNKAG